MALRSLSRKLSLSIMAFSKRNLFSPGKSLIMVVFIAFSWTTLNGQLLPEYSHDPDQNVNALPASLQQKPPADSTTGFITITNKAGHSIDVVALDQSNNSLTFCKKDGKKYTIPFDGLTNESKETVKSSIAASNQLFEATLGAYISLNIKELQDFQGFRMGMSPKEVASCFSDNYHLTLDPKINPSSDGSDYNINYIFKNEWSMYFSFKNNELVSISKYYKFDLEHITPEMMTYLNISSADQILKGAPYLGDGPPREFVYFNEVSYVGILEQWSVVYEHSTQQSMFDFSNLAGPHEGLNITLIDKKFLVQQLTDKLQRNYRELNAAIMTTDFSVNPQLIYDGFTTSLANLSHSIIEGEINQFISFFLQERYRPRDGQVTTNSVDNPRPYNLYYSWETTDGYVIQVTDENTISISKKEPTHL